MNFSAVLCDRDGVLIDSETANIDASLRALESLGAIIDVQQDVHIIMGKHPHDYVEDFVQKYNILGTDFLQKRDQLYNMLIDTVTANEDVCDFLRKMRTRGLCSALVTSASRENTDRLLGRLALNDLFDVMVTFDECVQRKPHPAPYQRAAYDLGLEASACLVIEDSPIGLLSAKNAGMTCVIRRNVRTYDINFSAADLVVNDACEIFDFMDGLSE